MKKTLLIASLGLNVLFIGRIIYYRTVAQRQRVLAFASFRKHWFQNRNDIFHHYPPDSTQIVFFGTSLTERFPVHDMFPGIKVVNRGVSSNTIGDLKDRLIDVTIGHPKKIFIEGGVNDISNGIKTDTTMNNFHLIIATIKKVSPNTVIYIQSILPTSYIEIQPAIQHINQLLEAYCKTENVTFINLYPKYVVSNKINPTLTYDGTHLNYNGYMIWQTEIKRFLN